MSEQDLMPPGFGHNLAYVLHKGEGYERLRWYYVRHVIWLRPGGSDYGCFADYDSAQAFADAITSLDRRGADEAFAALDHSQLKPL